MPPITREIHDIFDLPLAAGLAILCYAILAVTLINANWSDIDEDAGFRRGSVKRIVLVVASLLWPLTAVYLIGYVLYSLYKKKPSDDNDDNDYDSRQPRHIVSSGPPPPYSPRNDEAQTNDVVLHPPDPPPPAYQPPKTGPEE